MKIARCHFALRQSLNMDRSSLKRQTEIRIDGRQLYFFGKYSKNRKTLEKSYLQKQAVLSVYFCCKIFHSLSVAFVNKLDSKLLK